MFVRLSKKTGHKSNRLKIDLAAEEDRNIFNTLNAAVSAVNPVTVVANALTRDSMKAAYAEILKWDIPVARFVMNASEYADFLGWSRDEFDPVTQREVLQTGLFGRIWNADIIVSKIVPRGTIFVCGEAELLGVIPIRQDVNVRNCVQ